MSHVVRQTLEQWGITMTRTTRMTSTLVLAALGACAGGYGGGGSGGYDAPTSPSSQDDGRTITASPSLTFTPDSLTVSAGDAVTFAFGSVAHNVFFDQQTDAPATIGGENTNVSIKRTFTTAGSYHYTCHIHPSMQGTVVVR